MESKVCVLEVLIVDIDIMLSSVDVEEDISSILSIMSIILVTSTSGGHFNIIIFIW